MTEKVIHFRRELRSYVSRVNLAHKRFSLALPDGSAHKLRRYNLPRAKMPNVHRSRQAHNSMAALSTKGADSFMGLLERTGNLSLSPAGERTPKKLAPLDVEVPAELLIHIPNERRATWLVIPKWEPARMKVAGAQLTI